MTQKTACEEAAEIAERETRTFRTALRMRNAAKRAEAAPTFTDLWCRWQEAMGALSSDTGSEVWGTEVKKRNEAEARKALDDYVRGTEPWA